MKTAIQQIDKLLVYADGEVLYPNYNLLAAATGRFRVAKPELQNLVANENYNLRNLLLKADNVFTIDFSSQEPRMSAFRDKARENKSIEDFIADKDHHLVLAEDLKISRPQAKRIGLGLFYGTGNERLANMLNISVDKAIVIRDGFKQKYARTFEFIEQLNYRDEIHTPLLGRKIRFSKFKDYTKFNWLIQGSCVDLLLLALEHVLDSKKVELRAHIHDSLYLACLCDEQHPNCNQAREIVKELEELYLFTWPNTDIKVFKFGEIEWTTS